MGHNQREYVLRQQLKAIKEELGEIDEAAATSTSSREKIAKAKMPRRGREGRAEAARAPEGACSRRRPSTPSRAPTSSGSSSCRGRCSTEDKLDIQEARDMPRRGPLRPREGEEAHPRVPGGAQAQERQEGPDPLPRRAARRRQDVARPLDRARARPQVRPHLARRRARRGRDPRPPPHLRRRAARPHHPGHEEGRARTTRCSCSTRSTSSGTTSAATRRRRCSRCSTPSRTTRSRDHYLEVPFDLSKVMFVATANQLDPIPPALRDRLEIIELPGYTREEKLHDRAQFLVPKQLEEHGLTSEQLEIDDEAVARGHRQLHARGRRPQPRARDRAASAARVAVQGRRGQGADQRASITHETRRGVPRARRSSSSEVAERTAEPGVATGLAWTRGRRRHPLHRGDARCPARAS